MPNLFTKVKDRARAAAQPKPRTTHQVRGQVDTPFLLLTVLLVVVGLVMLLSASCPTATPSIISSGRRSSPCWALW